MNNIEKVKRAHKDSSHHAHNIKISAICGCFYCLEFFKPSKIYEWIDEDQTALCPFCGIDSVLPSISIYMDEEFLKQMNKYWFSYE